MGLGRPFQGCFVGGGICCNLNGNLITVQVAFALYQPPPWLCATAARRKGSPKGSATPLYCSPLFGCDTGSSTSTHDYNKASNQT